MNVITPGKEFEKTSCLQKGNQLKFIDLFAGIGGFHLALHSLGLKCVFASEWDKYARQTYEENFRKISPELFETESFFGNIEDVSMAKIPDFDVLCAGFPCQPFSQAGFKKGFNEARGTLFFKIAEIIKEKRPAAFFLENVRHLEKHNNGETFSTIKRILTQELGYSLHAKVIKASDFGLPQHRPRLFIVGFKNHNNFSFPEPVKLKKSMADIFEAPCDKKVGYTLRVGGRKSPIDDRRNWDGYIVNGKERRLTSVEGLKMQGFPDDFVFPVSETQAMKQLGNSVAVPAIRETAKQIIKSLDL